ncbi:MAG: C25 family cysteine peptidase [candidate division WOR-3 bacterium]
MKKALLTLIFILPAFLTGTPRWIGLQTSADETPSQFEVLSSDQQHTIVELNLSGFYVEDTVTPAGRFQRLRLNIPAAGRMSQTGAPELPVVARFIAVPDFADIDVQVLEEDAITLSGFRIYPAQPPLAENSPTPPFVIDEARYARHEFYPEAPARSSAPMIMRDFRLVQLVIQPVRFNPVTGELRVSRRIRVVLNYQQNRSGINPKIHRQPKISRAFEPLYRSFIANYRFVAPPQRAEDGSYLIIVNDQFASAVTPFAEWKKRKGWETRVVTTSQLGGNDTALIYNYIHNAYLTWPKPPDYVLLVGDAPEFVKCCHWPGQTDASDLYYSLHEGSDLLADLMIARVCVRTIDEARAVMNKLYRYEMEPYLANTEWFKRVCALAGYESGQPTRFWTVVIRIRNYVLGRPFTQFDTLFERWGLNTAQRLTDSLNQGRAWMLYRGHGANDAWANVSPSWTNSNVYALNNGRMTPMVIAPTCLSGNFDEASDCHAEAWLKAGAEKGGIGYFGASEVSYSGYNDSLAAGTFMSYVDSLAYTFVQCTQWGKLFMLLAYPLPDEVSEEELYMFNSFGDPELNIWSATPRPLTVSHPQTVIIGSFPFTVTVTDGTGPVANAQVCVMSRQDTTVYYVGHTDASGQINFNLQTVLPGDSLYVTVTGRNLLPYLGSAVTIAPNYPYVVYLRSIIDDSGGNGDGIINPGEIINLPTWVKNYGEVGASSVSGRIRIADPLITILDSVRDFGTVPAHDSAFTGPDGFHFAVAPACTNGHVIRFTLVCQDANDSVWSSFINLRVGAPRLEYAGLSVIDTAAGGNRNGRLDPQERVELILTLRNAGLGRASNVNALLRSGDPRLLVEDSLASFGLILPDSSQRNLADPFRVQTLVIPPETRVSCTLYVSALGGYSRVIPFTIMVGEIRSCDPIPDTGGTAVSYWAYDDVDTMYLKHPQFSWVEIRGLGTRLTLSDDQTVQISLPPAFGPFVFYGQSYNQISVCSNGWIAPGNTTVNTWSNTALPNTGMPPLLAVNWDDLYPPTGGGVWYYHDAANHRFIVEWDSVHYYSPRDAWDKFQVILYDTTRSDGDCEFLFQYLTANNYTSNTVGEQDPTLTRYIQVLYNGSYHRGAAALAPGRAILFTPEGPQTGVMEPASSTGGLSRLELSVVPSPVRGRARLAWQLPAGGRVRLTVYDASGRLVRTILSGELAAGRYQAYWDLTDEQGRRVANGLYLCRLETADHSVTTRAVLLH